MEPVSEIEINAARSAGEELLDALNTAIDVDYEVAESAWVDLAQYPRFVMKYCKNQSNSTYLHARDILLACGRHPASPLSPNADLEFTTPAWHPSARTNAAQLLQFGSR